MQANAGPAVVQAQTKAHTGAVEERERAGGTPSQTAMPTSFWGCAALPSLKVPDTAAHSSSNLIKDPEPLPPNKRSKLEARQFGDVQGVLTSTARRNPNATCLHSRKSVKVFKNEHYLCKKKRIT